MSDFHVKVNEILLREGNDWLYFTDPQRFILVDSLDDILPALHEVEWQTQVNGWYAAGFLSYEAASAFDPALQTRAASGFPYLWFGLYPRPRSISLPQAEAEKEILVWRPAIDRATYHSAIVEIKNHIAEGRTYQVNYTMRLQAAFGGDPWKFFLHLAQEQNKHAAYLDTGSYVICSASPELFFRVDGNTVVCRPMKGTTNRGRTAAEDQKQSEWLRHSEKNRAENVMIVDIVRNDLGRIAETGSVRVPALFQLERYPTLWQMTSTVTATTHDSLTEIFRALFPCASVTGAPKVSTMQIIAELENTPRKIYTGSIGYAAPQRKAKFNVAIRTVVIDRQTHKAEYGVGGGIVWDSTSSDEYAEAAEMADYAHPAGLKIAVHHQFRWSSLIRSARCLLLEGWVGEVLDVQVQVSIHTPWDMWPWIASQPRLEALYHSIHYLDSLRFLFGNPSLVTSRHTKHPAQQATGETKTITVWDYENGLQILIALCHFDWSPGLYSVFRVLGTDGLIEGTIGTNYDYPDGRNDTIQFTSRSRPERNFSVVLPGKWIPDAFYGPMASLMDAIQSGGEPITSARDNLGTLRVVEAAYRSMRERRSVSPLEFIA